MNLLPNWMETWTPEQSELELKDFKFQGPGVYRDKINSLLVLPTNGYKQDEKIWDVLWKYSDTFEFYFYNDRDITELLYVLAHVPLRSDE